MDVEAQVACVAEEHGVGQRWAATQLAWKIRIQAIGVNQVGEAAGCKLLHTHVHGCAAGTFKDDDALRSDRRNAKDRASSRDVEGVERSTRKVDIVPHSEAVNPGSWR